MDPEILDRVVADSLEGENPEVIRRSSGLPDIPGKIHAIIGPRRAGKTSFMFDLMKRATEDGTSGGRGVYINLEDDRLQGMTLADLNTMLEHIYRHRPELLDRGMDLYLDEVQEVEGWERFVRRILDTGKVNIHVTGSSSRLLSTEIATNLRGRAMTTTILPFSFSEILSLEGIEATGSTRSHANIMNRYHRYLEYGGYPEVVLASSEENRRLLLRDYVQVMLIRDVAQRYELRNPSLLRELFMRCVSTSTSPLSVHRFANDLKSRGMKVSKNTLYDYIAHLTDAFAIMVLPRYSSSQGEVGRSMKKVYPIDPGFSSLLGNRMDNPRGLALEQAVAVHLLRKTQADPLLELYYWSDTNGREVDFVLKRGLDVEGLIQVSVSVASPDTWKREVRAITRACAEFMLKTATIITEDQSGTENVDGITINLIPFWNWALDIA